MRKMLALTMLVLPLALFSQSGSSEKQTIRISGLTEPARLVRETPLVKDGRSVSLILHPDSETGARRPPRSSRPSGNGRASG